MLTYHFDSNTIDISEVENNEDYEFKISLKEPTAHYSNLKEVHHFFEDNKIYTDVLFYVYDKHEYKVVVRKDYYIDFVLTLMKFQLLQQVKWTS